MTVTTKLLGGTAGDGLDPGLLKLPTTSNIAFNGESLAEEGGDRQEWKKVREYCIDQHFCVGDHHLSSGWILGQWGVGKTECNAGGLRLCEGVAEVFEVESPRAV